MILNPEELVKSLLLRDDSRVADFGAGSGVFTVAAVPYIHTGKIYAIDIQRGLLPLIAGKIDPAKLKHNVEIVWGNIEELGGTKLREASIDVVIFANILFQIGDKRTAILEAKRVLRDGGRILLADWAGSFGNIGPREEDVIPKDKAKELFEKEGFVFEKELSGGDYHYAMTFTLHKT